MPKSINRFRASLPNDSESMPDILPKFRNNVNIQISKKAIGDQMRLALKVRNVKPAEATRRLKLPKQSSLDGWFKGHITIEDLNAFSIEFKVNVIWLLYGTGEFQIDYPLPDSAQ